MQLVGILQYKMLYVNGRRSFFRLRVCVCVWTGCCAHRSVRFLMYSSVELSCSRSIRNPKVCFEALTALLATASMWSAASLWLRGRKKKTKKKDVVKGESEFQRITDHYNCPRRGGNGFQHRRLPLHWLRSQDFSNYHIIVAHRRSSRGGHRFTEAWQLCKWQARGKEARGDAARIQTAVVNYNRPDKSLD